jgi:hypothetical protein
MQLKFALALYLVPEPLHNPHNNEPWKLIHPGSILFRWVFKHGLSKSSSVGTDIRLRSVSPGLASSTWKNAQDQGHDEYRTRSPKVGTSVEEGYVVEDDESPICHWLLAWIFSNLTVLPVNSWVKTWPWALKYVLTVFKMSRWISPLHSNLDLQFYSRSPASWLQMVHYLDRCIAIWVLQESMSETRRVQYITIALSWTEDMVGNPK